MLAVRRARREDATGILQCLHAAFAPYRSAYSEAGFRDTTLDASLLRERMERMAVFVADAHGRIVGSVTADEAEGHLRGLAVLPDAQGTGVGQRLLRRAIDELTVSGCERVTLNTTTPLERATRFYEAAAFRRSERVGDFFGMPLYEFSAPLDRAFEFREATAADGDDILRIVNAAFLMERAFLSGDRLGVAGLQDCFAKGTFLVASAEDGRPVASVFLRPDAEGRTYLGMLAVDPAAQGRRLGGQMMSAAERWCRRRGDVAIDIRVVNLRTELPPFYFARGFVQIGTEVFDDPRRFKPAHFVTMKLVL